MYYANVLPRIRRASSIRGGYVPLPMGVVFADELVIAPGDEVMIQNPVPPAEPPVPPAKFPSAAVPPVVVTRQGSGLKPIHMALLAIGLGTATYFVLR